MSRVLFARKGFLQVVFQGEDKDPFTAFGADIGIEVRNFHARDIANHLIQ